MSEPDRRELDWQLAMARASQRRIEARWHWPTLVLAGGFALAAAVLVWLG